MLHVVYSFCNTVEELRGFTEPWQFEEEHEPGLEASGEAETKESGVETATSTVRSCFSAFDR